MKRNRVFGCGVLLGVLAVSGVALARQEGTPPTRGEQEKSTENPANKNGTARAFGIRAAGLMDQNSVKQPGCRKTKRQKI